MALLLLFLQPGETDQLTNILFSKYFVGISAIVGLILSQIMIQKGRKDEKYKSAIEIHGLKRVKDIAAAVKVTSETAIKDLQKLIDEGFFSNGELNADKTVLVLDKKAVVEKVRTHRCSGCGATVVATSTKGTVCEYCGSPVNF